MMLRRLTVFLFAALMAAPDAMATEEPDYEVLLETKHYEIRRYKPYIVAEVDVEGDTGSAGNAAFRILAGYIFGNNEPGEKMAMTAPVESQQKEQGEKMAMTSPVLSDAPDAGKTEYTYAFVMEKKYTLDTLPVPLDPRIRIYEKPERTVAVRRFSGRWSEGNYRKHETALLEALATDRVSTTGAPMFARYNAPFTPWFMRRNEIQIEVAPDGLYSGVVRSTD